MTAEDREKKYVLAVDHGTSAMKVALADMCGQILAFECEDTPVYYTEGGGAEQNPDEWWDAFIKCSNQLIDKNLVSVDDIVAISCSSQWSGTVPVDSDGNHIMNAIIWMDSRGAQYIRKTFRGIINIDGCYSITNALRWIRKTAGIPTRSGKDPIAHILYMKYECPEEYARTFKFLEPIDYLNLKLTGKFAASHGSIMLYWVTDIRDIINIQYDDNLIKKLEIDRNKLPELKRSIDILGNVTDESKYDDSELDRYTALLENFALSILSPDENKLGSTARENLKNMAVIESAYLSARTAMPEEPGRILQMAQIEPTG